MFSSFSREKVTTYALLFLDFTILKLLYIKLLSLFIQWKTYFILKEEKEPSSLFDL